MTKKLAFKQLACAVAVSGAWLAANAAQTDLGLVSVGVPKAFNGSMVPAGTFSDTFEFSLPANGGSGYTVMNLPINYGGGDAEFNTLLTTMSLFRDPDGIPFNPGDVELHTVNATDPGQSSNSISFAFGPTAAGSYYLVVAGVTAGTIGGIYNGAISVSAVPEPEAWAMMLIGAGLVGFQLRRKSKQASAHRFV